MTALSGAHTGKAAGPVEASSALGDCGLKVNLPVSQPSFGNGTGSKIPISLEERKASSNRLHGKGSKGSKNGKGKPKSEPRNEKSKGSRGSGKGTGTGKGKGSAVKSTGKGDGKGSRKDEVKLDNGKGTKGGRGGGGGTRPLIETALRQPGPEAPVVLYNNGCVARDQGQLEEAKRLFRLAADKVKCFHLLSSSFLHSSKTPPLPTVSVPTHSCGMSIHYVLAHAIQCRTIRTASILTLSLLLFAILFLPFIKKRFLCYM